MFTRLRQAQPAVAAWVLQDTAATERPELDRYTPEPTRARVLPERIRSRQNSGEALTLLFGVRALGLRPCQAAVPNTRLKNAERHYRIIENNLWSRGLDGWAMGSYRSEPQTRARWFTGSCDCCKAPVIIAGCTDGVLRVFNKEAKKPSGRTWCWKPGRGMRLDPTKWGHLPHRCAEGHAIWVGSKPGAHEPPPTEVRFARLAALEAEAAANRTAGIGLNRIKGDL